MIFQISEKQSVIRSYSFSQKNTGIEYSLYVDEVEISKQSLISQNMEDVKSEKR